MGVRVGGVPDLSPLKLSLPPRLEGWVGGQSLAPLGLCWNRALGFCDWGCRIKADGSLPLPDGPLTPQCELRQGRLHLLGPTAWSRAPRAELLERGAGAPGPQTLAFPPEI